jgi:putative ABC transport system substrate-binding protein
MRLQLIGLIVILAVGLLLAPRTATAQQPTTVYRIGRLNPGPPIVPNPGLEAFRQRLHDLGYVEGQHFVIEDRHAEGRAERLPDLAAELVRLKVDVLVAGGGAAIRAAQRATQTIPIVMAVSGDAVRDGFVASLAHPGGNITGVSWLGDELPGKRLELLKATVPQSARVAVLTHPARPGGSAPAMRSLPSAARALGLLLHVAEVHRADELEAAFGAMTRAGADTLLVMEEPLLIDHLRGRIVALAVTHRLPAMYYWKSAVEAGGRP